MKIHEYNEMMAYLTRPARTGFKHGGTWKDYMLRGEEYKDLSFEEWLREDKAQGGVIGKGGMFQGEDMGHRTGFKKLDLTAQGLQKWKTLDEKITPSQLKRTAQKLRDLNIGKRNIARGIRITPDGNFRFSSEIAGGVSKNFDKATTLEEAIKWRDEWFKSKGLDSKGLRIKKAGPFKTVPGQPHIKFNGETYQINVQRMKDGKNVSPPVEYKKTLEEAIEVRDKLVLDKPPKSFAEYNIQERPKQVNADILELYKDPTIKNMFKNGVFDEKAIAKAAKILGVNKGTAIDRLEQLSTTLMGIRKNVPGIKPAFTENARKIVASLPGAKTKAAELATGVPLEGESIKVPKQEIVAKADYPTDLFDIDEARATATGLKKSTSPYSIFAQIIDRDVNRITKGGFEGAGWDSRAGMLEGELDDAVKNFGPDSKEAKAAMNKYNSAATKFENEVNSKKLRGGKRFRIPRISLDAPSKTIANWANFNKKYKDVFNENFKTKRYGFVIPKDLKTIPELRDEVLNPKSSTYKTMMNHLKKGFNEYDEKKLFQKIRRMVDEAPDAVKKIMRLIPRIAQVDDISDRRYASASNIMTSGVQYVDDEDENFVERNPITTAVVAPFLSKASGMIASKGLGVESKIGRNIVDPLKLPRKGARWIGKKALQALGSVPASLYFFQNTVRDSLKEGKSLADAIVNAEAGIELLYPEIAKRAGFGMKVLNPIAKRMMPVGVGLTTAGLLKDRAINMAKQAETMSALEPNEEQQRLIDEYAAADYKGFYNQGGRVGFGNGSGLPIDPMDPDKKLNAVISAFKKLPKRTQNMIGFKKFFEIYAKENFNQGGRVGLKDGSPKNPSRRAFLKGITALAALPIVGRFFKLADVAKQASTYTGPAIEKIKGMPEWFPQLVKKLFNEGEDVTKQMAFKDRQIVKRGTLEGGDDVDMIYDLDTGDVSINVTPKKGTYETSSGAYNKEYSLEYTKGQADEMTKGKPPDEFEVAELEGRADPNAMDIDWEGKMTTVDDAMSDLTELEAFAKNKTTTQIHKKKGTKPKDVFPDYDYDPLDDY